MPQQVGEQARHVLQLTHNVIGGAPTHNSHATCCAMRHNCPQPRIRMIPESKFWLEPRGQLKGSFFYQGSFFDQVKRPHSPAYVAARTLTSLASLSLESRHTCGPILADIRLRRGLRSEAALRHLLRWPVSGGECTALCGKRVHAWPVVGHC